MITDEEHPIPVISDEQNPEFNRPMEPIEPAIMPAEPVMLKDGTKAPEWCFSAECVTCPDCMELDGFSGVGLGDTAWTDFNQNKIEVICPTCGYSEPFATTYASDPDKIKYNWVRIYYQSFREYFKHYTIFRSPVRDEDGQWCDENDHTKPNLRPEMRRIALAERYWKERKEYVDTIGETRKQRRQRKRARRRMQ